MTPRKRPTLADLRPNTIVQCMYGHAAPSAGAVKFRAHHVCAECAALAGEAVLHEGDFLKHSDPRKTCADVIRARFGVE